MTITKRDISLTEALGAYLSYTPVATETHEFFADLRTMNHTLLRDSIFECQQGTRDADRPEGMTKRHLIHVVYTRKVKELAALYPFLFATENALRSIAAETYSKAFEDAYWWRLVVTAASEGKGADDFPLQPDQKKRIRKKAVNSAFIKECFFGVQSLTKRQIQDLQDGSCAAMGFYESLTIRSLFQLIHADMTLCPIGSLKKSDFHAHMITICDARNEIFHGRPIKSRSAVCNACEIILDASEFHMGDFDDALRKTTYTRQSPQIARCPKHLTPPKFFEKAKEDNG